MIGESGISIEITYDKEGVGPNDSVQVFLNGYVCGHFQFNEDSDLEYFVDTEELLPSGLSKTFERASNALNEDDLCSFMEKEVTWEVEKNLPFYEALGFYEPPKDKKYED